MVHTRFQGLSVDLGAIAALDLQEPLFVFGVKDDGGVGSGHHLAGSQVNVNMVLIIFVVFGALRNLGGATNIDSELGDVKSPILRGDLGVGLDTITVCLVDGVCMIFARLNSM